MRTAIGTAGLGLALLLVAGLFDAEPLYVPGVALPLLALLALAWTTLAAHRVTIERTLGAERVIEGDTLPVRIVARFAVPPPGAVLIDPVMDAPLRLRAGARLTRVRVNATFLRRGLRELEAPAVELADPLGLVRRRVTGDRPRKVLVLPRIEAVIPADGPGGERPGRALTPHGAAEDELDGLRPYREGAPASRIHWPAAARGAGLLERRLIADGDRLPLVLLDARAPRSAHDLDAAVRAAASLVHALARQGGCALLLPGDRRARNVDSGLGAWPDVHARLALVRAGHTALPPGHVRRGAIYYVCARPTTRLPRAVGEHRGGVVLVVPGGLPGRRPAFTVAGCAGFGMTGGRRSGVAA